jgi:hypothetical protein
MIKHKLGQQPGTAFAKTGPDKSSSCWQEHGASEDADRLRLWRKGIRDLVMEICCALHNFRVRFTPWQSMVKSG